MILVHYFDNNGFYTEDGFIDGVIPTNATDIQPVGLYIPRWDGAKWIEGDPITRDAVLAEAKVFEAKQAKIQQVSQITVTTSTGKVFDGNEEAQNRMARAVAASIPGDTTQWKLADNTIATVTHDELKEALRLAGEAMTAIWVV